MTTSHSELAGLKEIRRALHTRGKVHRSVLEKMGVPTLKGKKRGRGHDILVKRSDLARLNGGPIPPLKVTMKTPLQVQLDRIEAKLDELLEVWR